jgi:hypothetical protein
MHHGPKPGKTRHELEAVSSEVLILWTARDCTCANREYGDLSNVNIPWRIGTWFRLHLKYNSELFGEDVVEVVEGCEVDNVMTRAASPG